MTASVLVNAPDAIGITGDMRAAARTAPGGWLYTVDPHFDVNGDDVPDHGIIGAWRIDDAGEIRAEFRANPEYRRSPTARGWPDPGDELERASQLAAAGYATDDDVVIALLFNEVTYAVAADGAVALEDQRRIVVYSETAGRPGAPPDGASWQRSTGRALAVHNVGRAEILVNAGRWQLLVAGAELAVRAGGEAAGYLLAERIEDFLAGELDAWALHAAFCTAQVFCQAGAHPGFLAVEEAGDLAVPVFTSLVELARFAGQTAWFSALGQDVLNLLPDGYDVVVDAGTPRAVRLRGDATTRREPVGHAVNGGG